LVFWPAKGRVFTNAAALNQYVVSMFLPCAAEPAFAHGHVFAVCLVTVKQVCYCTATGVGAEGF
jgi:hypothetical protein